MSFDSGFPFWATLYMTAVTGVGGNDVTVTPCLILVAIALMKYLRDAVAYYFPLRLGLSAT